MCVLVSVQELVYSSLAVRNSRRGPGLVHHMIAAAGHVFMSADNNVYRVAESVYNRVSS